MRVMRLIRPIFNTPCWRINYDCQLGLDLSFGSPYLEIREPRILKSKMRRVRESYARRRVFIKASCWLWIQSAYWTLNLKDGRRVTWNSSAKSRAIAFARLEGEKVISLTIEPKTGRTTFLFDFGGVLIAKRFRQVADDTLWTLYFYCILKVAVGSSVAATG